MLIMLENCVGDTELLLERTDYLQLQGCKPQQLILCAVNITRGENTIRVISGLVVDEMSILSISFRARQLSFCLAACLMSLLSI